MCLPNEVGLWSARGPSGRVDGTPNRNGLLLSPATLEPQTLSPSELIPRASTAVHSVHLQFKLVLLFGIFQAAHFLLA